MPDVNHHNEKEICGGTGYPRAGIMQFKTGLTLIEVLIAIMLLAILFGGVYAAYTSILRTAATAGYKAEAAEVLSRQIETIRNMPYDEVGTVGGAPSGVLPQSQTMTSANGTVYTVRTFVRNVDDPFDGTLGGSPNDTSPADYKLVTLNISCAACQHFSPFAMTTTVAPKNLETDTGQGSLFITALNANGQPVPGATVRVTNQSVSPAIDMSDTTNQSGILQLIGVPPSAGNYRIYVGKEGYSSERSYPAGGADNPNPIKPDATVASSSLTQASFAIDSLSNLTVRTEDVSCNPVSGKSFTWSGSKLIGTNPDVYKFSTSSVTDSMGIGNYPSVEWDNYNFNYTGGGYDLLGTVPSGGSLAITPGTTADYNFILGAAMPESLRVGVYDAATGAGITGATTTLSKTGFVSTMVTGQRTVTQTDWSGGGYSMKDGVETDFSPGNIKLAGAPGSYSTSTEAWITSETIDTGSSTTQYYLLSWNPDSQPAATGNGSVRLQVAANNDGSTWNYVGPDGSNDSFFTYPSGTALPPGLYGERYLRYKLWLGTQDADYTPAVQSVSVAFRSACVPPGETYFGGLGNGGYNLSVSAAGYEDASSTVNISSARQSINIRLMPKP